MTASERLQEKRRQGTVTFPCTMYRADYRTEQEHFPFWARPHWHDAIEILHFEQGSFKLALNMDQYEIDSEAFCFISGGTLHSIRSETGYLEQALLFDAAILSSNSIDEAEQDVIYPLLKQRLTLPTFVRSGHPAFDEVSEAFASIDAIFADYGHASGDQSHIRIASKQLRIKAGIMNMLASLQEAGELSAQTYAEDPRIESFKQVLSYIRENYGGKIYLKDLAGIMNMNEQYFSRFFKKVTGKTPVAYINEIRIKNALQLLKHTQYPITTIALECGFGNMGHFIAQFKRVNGVSPVRIRAEDADIEL